MNCSNATADYCFTPLKEYVTLFFLFRYSSGNSDEDCSLIICSYLERFLFFECHERDCIICRNWTLYLLEYRKRDLKRDK